MKMMWKPSWAVEGREPTFVSESGVNVFGGTKYFWGNVPSFDILNLEENEGLSRGEDLHLLFAASGDMRSVLKTVASIPLGFPNGIHFVMNNRDLDIAARNVIMLLILLVIDDAEEAAKTVHLWYSSLIKQRHYDILQTDIKPLIQAVCDENSSKPPHALLEKTWAFGPRSLRLVLTCSNWTSLLSYLDVQCDLTVEKATEIRKRVTLAPERIDYRERNYFNQRPALRVGAHRFHTDGMLLPFGASRAPFTVPNPTMFQQGESWQLSDSSDPLNGWPLSDVSHTNMGLTTSDQYGKLYHHIMETIESCHARFRDVKVTFEVFHVDALDLPKLLGDRSFSRIEVSNIVDSGYLGLQPILKSFGPLLGHPVINPHATLITLFLNAVYEAITPQDRLADSLSSHPARMAYMPRLHSLPASERTNHHPLVIKSVAATELLRDFDAYFRRYMTESHFDLSEPLAGMVMRDRHKIIDKWPLRLKFDFRENGAQEEFDSLMESGHTGCERYVEWTRTGGIVMELQED